MASLLEVLRPGADTGSKGARAGAASKVLDAAQRAALESLLASSRRKQRAAHHLWLDGQTAEGYGLAVEAFRGLMAGLNGALGEPVASADLPGLESRLIVLCSAQDCKAFLAALLEAEALEVPVADVEFRGVHAAMLERLWQSQSRLHRYIEQALGSAPRRRWRWLAPALVAALLALGALAHFRRGVTARASAEYSAEHAAEHAIDGVDATEWLLPDRKTGWLDVKLKRPEHVREVHLLNAHNRHYNDRATRKFKIELYDGARMRASVEAEYQKLVSDPSWRIVPVPEGRVTRIRIFVLSHFEIGGGLAEVKTR